MKRESRVFLLAALLLGSLAVGAVNGESAVPGSESGGAAWVEALATGPDNAVAPATGSKASGSAAGEWCYFCEEWEGHAVNDSLEWEEVVYAYCIAEPNTEGRGADYCVQPQHEFAEGMWLGAHCDLDPWNGETGNSHCDCSWDAEWWPANPRTIHDCNAEVPASAVGADGLLGSVLLASSMGQARETDSTYCNGIIEVLNVAAHSRTLARNGLMMLAL